MTPHELGRSIVELDRKIKTHYNDECGVCLNIYSTDISTPVFSLTIHFIDEAVDFEIYSGEELKSKIEDLKEKPCDLW